MDDRARSPTIDIDLVLVKTQFLHHVHAWEAKASFSSTRSMSSVVKPASLRALREAVIGAIPSLRGRCPRWRN